MGEFNYNLYEINNEVFVANKDWDKEKTLWYYNLIYASNTSNQIKQVDPLEYVKVEQKIKTIKDIVLYIAGNEEDIFIVPQVLCSKI